MKIKIYQILLFVLLLNSCSDYFDVSPKTDVKAEDLFQDENGFDDALIGVYTLMSTKQMYGDNLNYSFLDVLAQYYPAIKDNSTHNFIHAAQYNFTEVSEENRLKSIWSRHYQAIANLNAVLLYIDDHANDFSEGVYSVFKGETIALRGYLHFNLLRLFAQAPVLGTDATAIPYVSVYSNQAQPALTVAEVLEKIKTDLVVARDLMKDNDPYGPNYQIIDEALTPKVLRNREFRMNYFATTAALSMVNIYEGDIKAALENAQEIIGSSDGSTPSVELFSLANLSSDITGLSETIFGLDVNKLSEYSRVYFGSEAYLGLRNNWLAINASLIEEVYTPVGASSIDNRSSVFFGESQGGERPLAKFFNETTVPLVKISELYLIAAEAESNLENALAYYNKFTASRGIEAQQDVTREELDVLIYKEYQKEFIGEGKLFWFYKRKNYDMIGLTNNVSVESSNYVLPIPAEEYEFGNL